MNFQLSTGSHFIGGAHLAQSHLWRSRSKHAQPPHAQYPSQALRGLSEPLTPHSGVITLPLALSCCSGQPVGRNFLANTLVIRVYQLVGHLWHNLGIGTRTNGRMISESLRGNSFDLVVEVKKAKVIVSNSGELIRTITNL